MSVVLPCRNAGATVDEAIASLEAQTMSDFEAVVVDDASTDGTRAALEAWSGRDRRVRILDGAGEGIVRALSLALRACRSPLVARMDADDVAMPDRLEAQCDRLDGEPGLSGCGTHVEMFSVSGVGSGYRRYEAWINAIETPDEVRNNAFIECPVAHPTLMIRRPVVHGLGGYRDMGWPEDYDLVLRTLAVGGRLANVTGRPLLRWRAEPGRLSLRSEAYGPAAFRRCKVHFLCETILAPGEDVIVWGAGKVGKPFARELLRQGVNVSAFVELDPRKIGQEIHGAPVWSPGDFERFLNAGRIPGGRPRVLAAVGSPGVRDEIREALARLGLAEPRDFRFCA